MSKERAKRGTLPPAQEQIEKFEKVVEEGNYHGAQQLYKSISARYVAAQRYTEALDILQSGACIQLKHGQVSCGAELAALFVDTLVKARCPYDDETLGQLLASSVKHSLPPVHPSLFSVASAGAPSSISSIKADYIARQQCKASSSPLVLCTDDSGVFSTSTSNEYNLAASAFGLGRREIFQLTRNSCKFIFADDGVKRELKEIFSSPEHKLD